jgi:hypothetical protein
VTDGTRWAWARLNADTLFLVLLATFSGIFDIIEPHRDAVTVLALQTLNEPSPMHYIRAGAYVVFGLMLLAALLWSSVRLEVLARCLLISAVVLNAGRHVWWLGWQDTETAAQLVLLAVIALVTALRFSVLLSKRGLVVTQEAAEVD